MRSLLLALVEYLHRIVAAKVESRKKSDLLVGSWDRERCLKAYEEAHRAKVALEKEHFAKNTNGR